MGGRGGEEKWRQEEGRGESREGWRCGRGEGGMGEGGVVEQEAGVESCPSVRAAVLMSAGASG